jgi:hypothetical protein
VIRLCGPGLAEILLREFAMKRGAWCVAICLALGSLGWSQQTGQQTGPKRGQATQEESDSTAQSPDSTQRPTLGPATGPAVPEGVPRTANPVDAKKLLRIHSLYVERIDNELSDKLVEAIAKTGRFRIVTKPKEADATVRGSCLDLRRLKTVHSEVFISDRSGASVWQDSIRRPFNPLKPPSLEQAVSDTAAMVAEHLEATVREAARK